jgi:hypothetical protein
MNFLADLISCCACVSATRLKKQQQASYFKKISHFLEKI